MIDPQRLARVAPSFVAPVAVVLALGVGAMTGLGPGLLVLAGAVLLGAVLLFWSSLQRLTGESPLTLDEAVGLGAPSPEEEKKRSIVRALKDLEYERSVGKISEEDFAELSARYRAEAKALLQSLHTELAPLRDRAEQRLAARLKREGIAPAARPSSAADANGEAASRPDPTPSPDGNAAAPSSAPPGDVDSAARPGAPPPADVESDASSAPPSDVEPATRPSAKPATEADASRGPAAGAQQCPACATLNDADARFCKACATPLAEGS